MLLCDQLGACLRMRLRYYNYYHHRHHHRHYYSCNDCCYNHHHHSNSNNYNHNSNYSNRLVCRRRQVYLRAVYSDVVYKCKCMLH